MIWILFIPSKYGVKNSHIRILFFITEMFINALWKES